jgi:hypothetical protein
MKTIAAALLLLLGALPSAAGTRSCTNSMVTAGICPATSWVAYCISIDTADPDGAGPLLAPTALVQAAFANVYGWTATMTCTADMVAAGTCSAGALGTVVSVTQPQFVDFKIRTYILGTVRRFNAVQAMAAAEAAATAQADPNLGN